MKTKLFLCMIACCLFVACGSNSSRSFSLFGNDEPEVMCPMCGGTGIFSYMPGDIMAPKEKCSGCNGTGKMPQSKAAKLQQDINTINNMFGGGSGGGGNYNGGSGGGGGRDYTECPICYDNSCFAVLDSAQAALGQPAVRILHVFDRSRFIPAVQAIHDFVQY